MTREILKAALLLLSLHVPDVAGSGVQHPPAIQEAAFRVMDGFDANRDHLISMKELLDHVGKNPEVKAAFGGWQAGFLEADSNRDGHLNVDELASLLGHVSGQDQTKLVEDSELSVASAVMDGFDTNKDGKISLKELLDHAGAKAAKADFEGWQSGFLTADVDQDGHLNVKELASLLNHVSRQDQTKLVEESEVSVAESIMDGFDSNRDGTISMKELITHVGSDSEVQAAFKGWQAGFLEADVDQDGRLNIQELATLLNRVSRQDQHNMVEQSEMSVAESIMSGFDVNKDGQISLQELLENVGDDADVNSAFGGWQQGFLDADADRNGKLSLKELTSLLDHTSRQDQHMLVDESEVRMAASIMDGFDSNKDGTISLKELLDHAGEHALDAAFGGWQQGFLDADADKDGRLTIEELASLLKHVSMQNTHELMDQSEVSVAESIMDGFDTNKDGKISPKELLERVGENPDIAAGFGGWQKGFLDADSDKDGHLDVKELAHLLDRVSRPDRIEMVHSSEESVAQSIMDGFDTNKDKQISLQELLAHVGDNPDAAFKGWQAGFLEADADRNGHLDVSELAQMLDQVSRPEQHKLVGESEVSVAASIMDGFDSDKDGKISINELLDRVGPSGDPAKDAYVASTFQGWQTGFLSADVDRDGYLSLEELASLLAHVSRQEQHQMVQESEKSVAASIMDGFDINKDRKISMTELLNHVGDTPEMQTAFKGWQAGFLQADSNEDGHLTVDELASLLEHVSRQDQHKMVEESEVSVAGGIMDGFDTNKDGKISLKELLDRVGTDQEAKTAFKGWQAGFLEADVDRDGHLSIKELASLLDHVGRQDQHKMVRESEMSVAESILDGFDTDRNGKISLKELLDHTGDNSMRSAFGGWQAGFLEADADRDGQLTLEEITSLLDRVSRQDQHMLVDHSEASMAASILTGFDTNHDGKISLNELLHHTRGNPEVQAAFKGWQAGFLEADADRDGHLDVTELASLLNHISRQDQHALVEESAVASSILDSFDKNKDGLISLMELLDKVGIDSAAQEEFQGWVQGFKLADADKDEHLNAGELEALLEKVNSQPTKQKTRHDEF